MLVDLVDVMRKTLKNLKVGLWQMTSRMWINGYVGSAKWNPRKFENPYLFRVGTLGSFMFGSWIGIKRLEIHIIPCELAWGLFSGIVGNWSQE